MLTPIDIDNEKFSRQFKGYDVTEVDNFLNRISDDYEELMLKNKELEEKVAELEEMLTQYKSAESSLQETLLIAKRTTDTMKKQAEEEANQIIEEANRYFETKTGNIDEEIRVREEKLSSIINQTEVYKRKTEALLVAQLEVLKTLNVSDEEIEENK